MKTRLGFLSIALMLCSLAMAQSQSKEKLQQYFNSTAVEVRAESDPVQKRAILDKSLSRMSKALDMAEDMGAVTDEDKTAITRFKESIHEKQYALAGINGYRRVPDDKLNDYANYIVQEFEQAAEYVTISLCALLLIILIVILIF